MTQLLSKDLWPTVRELAKETSQVFAAISYVTKAHLSFKSGDVLVCDASNLCVQSRTTSTKLLRRFYEQGAALYSLKGLHAKVAVLGDYALVGSANMSSGSEERIEAALLTKDPGIREQVMAFVEGVTLDEKTKKIDERFLRRIEKLPLLPSPRKSKPKVEALQPRFWLVPAKWVRPQPSPEAPEGPQRRHEPRPAVDSFPAPCGGATTVLFGDMVIPVLIESKSGRIHWTVESPTSVTAIETHGDGLRCYYKPIRSPGLRPINRLALERALDGVVDIKALPLQANWPVQLPEDAVRRLEQRAPEWFRSGVA
ncbi:hypothetical protein LP414_23100 [Polaromonas sp. P1(28)-13]|nr:hypothetical protein LP414_23100 [Polaromonas sp. P1(28)-13]